MAIGLYRRLAEARLKPDRDIAVIGQRARGQSAILSPNLTTFRMAAHEIGEALATRLLRQFPRLVAMIEPGAEGSSLWPFEPVVGERDCK